MLEIIVLLAFVSVLMLCVLLDVSIICALAIGYGIFFFYSIIKGYKGREVLGMSLAGVKTVKNMLIIFLLIGMITSLWRAAGTIPVIICYAAKLISPSAFLLIAFLLNSLVSTLTGTAFGTAATMGVICMSMATTMGIEPLYMGGAILSGVYLGDRCSPVSTSAFLVCELTGTDIYNNIKNMIKTAVVPMILACLVYLILGLVSGGDGAAIDVEAIFAKSFVLQWYLMLPALMILILAVFRVKIRTILMVSIATAAVFCVAVQGMPFGTLLKTVLFGYQAADPEVAAMMNGGGLSSMVSVALIVGLSSSFAGIFEGTGLLNNIKHYIAGIGNRITSFGSILVVSLGASMIACNQALSIILTHQVCRDVEPDKKKLAIYLENTVVVVAPLIPWSIAGAVPLATVGAPLGGMAFACYLYLLPLWNLLMQVVSHKRKQEPQ